MGLLYQLAQMLGEARKAADTPFVADWRSLLGLVCVVLVGSVANTAGVGGGAVFVPLFQALMGFPLKESTALSQALITAGSVVSVLLNLFSASPVDPSKPLIDFPLVLLLLPMLLVGVGIGVLLNVILPSYLISVLLFVLMCLLITQSLAKGIRMWILETRLQQMLQHELPCKGASHDEAFSGAGSPASHEADESVHLLCATIDEEQPPASPPLPPQGEAERGVAVAAAAAAAAAQTAPPLRGQAASAEGQRCEHDGQQGGAEAAAPVTPSRQRRPPRPRPPPASFRPSAEALRRLTAGGGAAPGGGGGADATWVTRRNAWLTRFLHTCDEHGSEALPLAAFPVPPMPPTQPQQRREGGGQGVAGPRLGKCTSARVVTGGSVRYQAAAKPLYEPLLSPEDSAAARAPHGRKKKLPPEQWDLTSGKSDAELLDALLADAAVSGGALAGARGAVCREGAEGQLVGKGRRQPSVSGQEPALPSRNAAVLVSFHPAGKAGTAPRGKEAGSCEGERDVEAPPPGPLPVGTACRRSDEPEAEALSSAPSSSAPAVSPRPRPRLPWGILAALGACWALYVGLQLAQRATTRCSPPWWALFAAQSLLLPSFSVCAVVAARRRAASAEPVPGGQEEGVCGSGHGGGGCGHGGCSPGGNPEKPVEDRLGQLDLQQFLTYQALALTAGLIGGLLGLGGGMIIGPLLLEMGVHPQVSSATSSMCVLFSSSTALISVAALGYLNTQHAVVFSGASMVASVLGLVVIGGLIRRTGRVSLAVLSLSLVMLLGGAAVGGIGITVVMDAIRNGEGGFHSMCPKSQ